MENEEYQSVLTPKHEELVRRLCKLFPEADIEIEDYIPMKNYWGVDIGIAKGVSYRRVTQSYADGPEHDFSDEIKQILLNCGFEKAGYYSSGYDERYPENYEIYRFAETSSIVYDF